MISSLLLIARVVNRAAELFTFAYCLLCDGQWREYEHSSVVRTCDVMRPLKLHRRLTKAAVREDCGAPFLERPLHDIALEVEQHRVQFGDGAQAGRRIQDRLTL